MIPKFSITSVDPSSDKHTGLFLFYNMFGNKIFEE